MIEYSVVPLSEVIGNKHPTLCEELRRQLDSFPCARSSLIQVFARPKAFENEKHGWTRSYLLVTEAKDDPEGIDVAGFFSIGITAINLDHESNTLSSKKVT